MPHWFPAGANQLIYLIQVNTLLKISLKITETEKVNGDRGDSFLSLTKENQTFKTDKCHHQG